MLVTSLVRDMVGRAVTSASTMYAEPASVSSFAAQASARPTRNHSRPEAWAKLAGLCNLVQTSALKKEGYGY